MAQFSRYYHFIEPITKSPQTRGYTMFILSIFAIAFFGFFAIRPTILTIIGLQKEILQAQDIDKKLAAKIAALGDAQAVWDNVESKRPLLGQATPETPHIAQFMRLLESVAAQSGVTLGALQVRTLPLPGEENPNATASSPVLAAETDPTKGGAGTPAQTQPKPTMAPPALNEIKLTFTATGGEANIEAFLNGLYLKRRLVSVNDIHLLAQGADRYIAELAIVTYTTTPPAK